MSVLYDLTWLTGLDCAGDVSFDPRSKNGLTCLVLLCFHPTVIVLEVSELGLAVGSGYYNPLVV